ncbi:carboxylesterase/lipase family protein [Streptomyces sp. NBC_01462]|uniref:carboxylesterase/lipase family protein n=1 Tax=Streptomyces sp. NBC_01462 TaxID=2903876 RepID=UPI002E325CD7|nr:carboxylesterase family protein [Streptomyces sp. NBC_01462]
MSTAAVSGPRFPRGGNHCLPSPGAGTLTDGPSAGRSDRGGTVTGRGQDTRGPVAESVEIDVHAGRLRGRRTGAVDEFLGVPYAAAPVGPRRLRPPEPAPAWVGVRDATRFGAASPQPGSARARVLQGDPGVTGEDCLSLNVWTPADAPPDLPVLVWVHGGAFTNGAGSVPALHGRLLSEAASAVVVTVNYRLGALGFACHDSLGAGTANLGLRDLVAALEWVHENVAVFGGDPGRVTLAGESAGSMCVALLSLSPAYRHLFAQVALHSGVPSLQSPAASERAVEALATRLGVRVSALRSVPGAHILTATRDIAPDHRFWPTATGWLASPLAGLQSAAPARPTLISTTADEGTFFFIDGEWPEDVSRDKALSVVTAMLGPDAAKRYAEAAQPARPLSTAAAAITERLYTEPADRWADRAATAGSTVFRAEYAHPSPAWEGRLGATHTVDVPLLFGTFAAPEFAVLYESDVRAPELSSTVRRAWSRFLHTGSPATAGYPWRPWSPDDSCLRRFL